MTTPMTKINSLIQQGRLEDANILFAEEIKANSLRNKISHIYVAKAYELTGPSSRSNSGITLGAHAKLIKMLAVENDEEFNRVLSGIR